MIQLTDLNSEVRTLIPVTTSELFVGKSQIFHPEGLFSEKIFGSKDSSRDRKSKISFIDLNCKVLHPACNAIIYRIQRNLIDFISTEKKFELDEHRNLIESETGTLTGITKLIEIFDKINFRGDTKVRIDMINMLKYYNRKKLLFIDKCIIIAPHYRNINIMEDGTMSIAPINEYYLQILKMSQQIKSVSDPIMFDVLSYKIFLQIQELYDYIGSKITKKEGIIRSSLLGKRVDFSGRAVVAGAASELKIDEIGVPFNLLIRLFEPFILNIIMYSGKINKEELNEDMIRYNESELNAVNLRRLFSGIYKHDVLPSSLQDILVQATNIAISDKIVLAKRDPSLHAESVQAFKPILLMGNVIKLNPLSCSAYNADFDGDQMALYVPITKESIEEAKEKMVVSSSKDGIGQINNDFSKDIALGIYFLTKDATSDKYIKMTDIDDMETVLPTNQKVKYKNIDTTIGRVLFNIKCLPEGYIFVNDEINKKKLSKLAFEIYNKHRSEYKHFCDMVLKLAFKYGTIMSRSFSFDDFFIPKSITALKEKMIGKKPEDAQKIIEQMTKMLQEYLEKNKTNLGETGLAGGLKGGYDQARQILVAKGLIKSPTGETLPAINQSYAEGLDNKTFFNTGSGTRSGIADRVLNTSKTGYLSRQLVYACQRVEVDPHIKDCRTQRTLEIKATSDIARRLKGRFVTNPKNILDIRSFDEKTMLDKMIHLRSPVYCLSRKLCMTCYGMLAYQNTSPYVGVNAGQIIGERMTQLIMKTFHSGGAVNVNVVDIVKIIGEYLESSELIQFNKYFHQKGNDLISNKDGKIIIKKSEYLDSHVDIKKVDKTLKLAYTYIEIHIDDKIFDLPLDIPSIIELDDKQYKDENEVITIEFQENSKVFICVPTTDNFLDKVQIVSHLFSGKKPYKDPSHFVYKMYSMFKNDTNCDYVHFEVLASQFLRDVNNPTYPARLNKNYNAFIGSIKDIPGYESWLSSISFENFNKSITNGLLYDTDIGQSVLEKLIVEKK